MNKWIYLVAVVVGLILGWWLLSQPILQEGIRAENDTHKEEVLKTPLDSLLFQEHSIKIIELKRSWDGKKVQEVNVYNGDRLTNRILINKGLYLGMEVGYQEYEEHKQSLCIWTTEEEIILLQKDFETVLTEDVEQLQLFKVIQSPYNKVDINWHKMGDAYLTSPYKTSGKNEEEVWTRLVWRQNSEYEAVVLGHVKLYTGRMYYYPNNAEQDKKQIVIPVKNGDSQEGSIREFWQERYNKK